MKKIEYLDALRGLAILGVITTHVTVSFPELNPIIENIGRNGNRGVQLFFLVSAFTLMLSYEKRETFDLKGFYIRRFFRIAPAFYAAFIFYLSFNLFKYLLGMSNALNTYNLSNIIGTISFMNVLRMEWLFSLVPGGWSISNEVMFYLLLPFIYKFIKNSKTAIILFISSVIILVPYTLLSIIEYNFKSSYYMYFFYWFPNQLPIFLLGIVLYFVSKKYKSKFKEKFNLTYANIILYFITTLIILFASIHFISYFTYFNHLIFGILFSIFAFVLSIYNNKIFVNKFTIFIGKISFSMYLIHFFFVEVFLTLIKKFDIFEASSFIQFLLFWIITLLSTILLSIISHKYIEVPGINIGRKLSNKTYKK
ncbi:acyltransferase [Macrococcus sp. DPC7161]|uniref:acyltransferase family protein n=1 Tax=Macrococcus sp. DPC7161 TaxID=2507060 RepID=UPI00100B4F42|nr:acyltransferase [Macrococcus sp. DPC7161]RXK17236.1 acyltransferase [Macrococcus sp. DPC7161]